MKNKVVVGLIVVMVLMGLTGAAVCAKSILSGVAGFGKSSYFGVPNQAVQVPDEFGQTEAAIMKAEKSPGAQYCPEKIAKAKELAKKGVETYWACRTKEAMKMLAEARKLAAEAELCKAPPPARKKAPPPPPPAASKDSDGDGVPDDRDQCPGTPKGATVDARGCWVYQAVLFDFGKATIKPAFYPMLDEAAAILKKNPAIKVEIQGHTDNVGSKAVNQRLSADRAKAVVDYLVKKGISKDRLAAKGYDFSKPVASNDTKEGRAKNRRVEFRITAR